MDQLDLALRQRKLVEVPPGLGLPLLFIGKMLGNIILSILKGKEGRGQEQLDQFSVVAVLIKLIQAVSRAPRARP